MQKWLSDIKAYRTSIAIIVILVLTILGVSYVYKKRIEDFMVDELRYNIISSSLSDMDYVNKNFNDIIDILNVVSNSLSDKQYIGGASTITNLNSITKVTGFVNIGIVSFNGETIHGFAITPEIFSKIKPVFHGKPVITVLNTDGDWNSDVMIAVPIFESGFVKYSLYIRATNKELVRFFSKGRTHIEDDQGSLSFLIYNLQNIVDINDSTKNRLLPSEVLNYLQSKYNDTDRDYTYELEQGSDEVYILDIKEYPLQYMSVIPTEFDGWNFVMLIPTNTVDNKIKAIMMMLGILVLGTISVLVVLLVFYEYTVHKSRRYIHDLAYLDEDTKLTNKASLRETFQKYREVENHTHLYIIKIVISNLDWIRRLYGFVAADKFIINTAEQIRNLDEQLITSAKLSDGFVLLLEKENVGEVKALLENFVLASESTEGIEFKAIFISSIVECTTIDLHKHANVDHFLENCDIAVFQSKIDKTKHCIVQYERSMREEIERCDNLEKELEPALANGEFLVYLQPKYDLRTNKLYGAEALIRWNVPEKGIIPPFQFIPIFERNGSIAKIDNFVFLEVLKLLKKWKSLGYRLIPVSVNFSQVQFLNPNLLVELNKKIQGFSDVIRYLEIEITESATIDDKNKIISILNSLKSMGFKLSMDDFGTGYSSLSNVSIMPFDTIKLDKSFVDKIDVNNPKSTHVLLVQDVISLSKHMNIHCLVEGVETIEQRNILRDLGCEYCQGYYYSKPLPVADFEELLREDKEFHD